MNDCGACLKRSSTMETTVVTFLLLACLAAVVASKESLEKEGVDLHLDTLDEKFIRLKKEILEKVMVGTGLDPESMGNFDPKASEIFMQELKEVMRQILPHSPELHRSLVGHIMKDVFEGQQAGFSRDPTVKPPLPR